MISSLIAASITTFVCNNDQKEMPNSDSNLRNTKNAVYFCILHLLLKPCLMFTVGYAREMETQIQR